ncbi:MAG: hypothetical protein QOK24_2739 [Verrucomicrobiota bacterium]|jgi:hypothetical protein
MKLIEIRMPIFDIDEALNGSTGTGCSLSYKLAWRSAEKMDRAQRNATFMMRS